MPIYTPRQARVGWAGFDILVPCRYMVPTGGRTVKLKTNIQMAIPRGYFGRVNSTSGLYSKHGINSFMGVIDADYRGQLIVLVMNNNPHEDYVYKEGHKRAKLTIEAYWSPTVMMAYIHLQLTDTHHGGFGSTGK